MSVREKLATISKGIFADSSGQAVTLPYGQAANTNAGPNFDLTGYLSAMPPLPSMGPADVEVRKRDFALAENLDYIPLNGKGTILKGLADKWNALRIIIDTKKDLVATVPWSIKVEPEEGEDEVALKARTQSDSTIQQLTDFFNSPDAERTWFEWIKEYLENIYVLDAGCIEVVRDDRGYDPKTGKAKGKICKLVVVSGDTINRVIDDRGWTPMAPQVDKRDNTVKYPVAYQHVFGGSGQGSEGVPQRNLTVQDMCYSMRNPRPAFKYGQCHDDITETLTKDRGFVLFKDLIFGEKIATRNLSGEFEWQAPTAYVDEHYEGKMFAFTSRSMDLLVTPNHRMLVSMPRPGTSHNREDRNEKIMPAEDLVNGLNVERKIPVTSTWKQGVEVPAVVFEKTFAMAEGSPYPYRTTSWQVSGDDYCALMGAYLAEGNLRVGGGIEVNQSENGNGYGLYRQLFERINGSAGYNGRAFIIARKALGDHCGQFGHSEKKFVPDVIRNAPKRQLEIFWKFYMAGDGCCSPKPNVSSRGKLGLEFQSSTTVSRLLSDHMVEIAQKLGYSASVATIFAHVSRINPLPAPLSACKEAYQLHVRYSDQMAVNAEKTWYKGRIYCVTVPNGVIMTRRNGKTAWSGNSSVEKIFQYALTGVYADEFIKDYYTSGNQPPGIIVLSGMPPEKIEEYEKKWNAVYAGNLATRRRIAMISAGPGDQKNVQYIPTKEPLLKSDIYMDYIRFACAEFSVPSVPFERPMNRASAKEQGDQATQSGLVPDLTWLSGVLNRIIKSPLYFNLPKYTFTFGERRPVNAIEAANVDKIYVSNAMETINEGRKKIGLPPSSEPNADKLGVMSPQNGWIPLNSDDFVDLQKQTAAAKPKPPSPSLKPPKSPASPSKKAKSADADFVIVECDDADYLQVVEKAAAANHVQPLYVARHGMTPLDEEKRSAGDIDESLTEDGIKAAEKLRDRLKGVPLTAIHTSDLSRTRETGAIIAEPHGIKPEAHPELRPLSMGDAAGKTRKETRPLIEHHIENPDEVIPGSDESINDFRDRVRPELRKYIDDARKGKGPRLLVVHGSVIDELGLMHSGDTEEFAGKPGCLIAIYPTKNKFEGSVLLGARPSESEEDERRS